MLKFTILFFIIIKFISVSFAEDNSSVVDLINKQLKIIEEQDKRIKNLENIVNELKNKIDNQNVNNVNESPSTPSSNSEQNLSESSNESEIGSSSSQKVYNPEKAFFGPLQPLKSKDGNYTAGFMGLIQLDGALHNQEANYNNNNDLSDGFIVRRAVLTLAGLSEKDWIWFLAYNYASEGDYPKNGLGAAMAIYR